MKKIQTLLLIAIFISTTAFAQSGEEKALQATVDKLVKTLLDPDKATLESLTADELSYGHSSGVIEDKKTFVDALVSGKSDFVKIDISNQTMKVVGNTAWVRHELRGANSAGPLNLGILLVWIKQKGEWKLLARQAFKLPQ